MRRADVIVIGAGPAGCAAATVLAETGHAVMLVDRPPARRAFAESIPPSAQGLLIELGMDRAVARAGFHPWTGNTVWWAGAPPRMETFAADATGYQVERDRFDSVLRDVAVSAGAQLVTGPVREVNLVQSTVLIDGGRHVEQLTAPWILDCSGRSGVIARNGLRVPETSHETIAMTAIWRAGTPWPVEQAGHTLVASHADGWAWSVPVAPDTRFVTVMVDPERSHLTRSVPAIDVYRAELAKVQPFAEWLADANLVDGPWGAHSSLYSARQHAGPGFLLVGDAASFIDPLSSFGVKKALASGWLAGVVINTVINAPTMQAHALAFFESRERAIAASLRQQAARYAEDAGATHPFWEARATDGGRVFPGLSRVEGSPGESVGSKAPTSENHACEDQSIDPSALAHDPDVIAAVRDLQLRPAADLCLGPDARIEPRPVIRGRALVMEDYLSLPSWPDGLRYIRNVDLVLVAQLAPQYRDVGELFEAIVRIHPGVSLPDVLGVLGTLLARGGLQHKV